LKDTVVNGEHALANVTLENVTVVARRPHITHSPVLGGLNYLRILALENPKDNAWPDNFTRNLVRETLVPGYAYRPGLPPNFSMTDDEFLAKLKDRSLMWEQVLLLVTVFGCPEILLEEAALEGGVLSGARAVELIKETEGVYDITAVNKFGEVGRYVGQSKNILKRILRHFGSRGRLSLYRVQKVIKYAMEGSSPLEREVYEQYLIDKIGMNNLLNAVNPMGGRRELYNSMVDFVIRKFGLPR
jgi:hypothetical protein